MTMSERGTTAGGAARDGRGIRRYALGQALALVVVVLIGLPLLPALLLVVAWIRLRHRP